MRDPFARMHERLAARLGSEAFLRVTEPCQVDVTHGVAITGEYNQVTGYRSVVEILTPGMNAALGDPVTVGTTTYVLDALVKDDGYTSRWIVLE